MAKADGWVTERCCDERRRWGARQGKIHADQKWAFATTAAGTWHLWNAQDSVWAGAKDDERRAYERPAGESSKV